ncbi:hypothetical protein HYW60_04020 [Candidatus Kaiserbacteria bacterium]|nr:hypothetical protein [Candidatus Kaiserbacteria bacterium]
MSLIEDAEYASILPNDPTKGSFAGEPVGEALLKSPSYAGEARLLKALASPAHAITFRNRNMDCFPFLRDMVKIGTTLLIFEHYRPALQARSGASKKERFYVHATKHL